MTTRTAAPILSTLALLIVAGTIAPAVAQPRDASPVVAAAVAPTVDFRSYRWLSDRKVVNNNGEDIANVSDLILDRGSGRIEYVVIKTGTTLGMGGKAVAIPYAAFRWESGRDRFILASTTEQLKQFPEYTLESWKAMRESVTDDKSTLRQKLAADAAAPGDPYAGNLEGAAAARVEGEIQSVDRVRTSTFGEQVVVTVLAADGTTKKVALGPSWYVNATPAAPMRGDKVKLETLALPRDPDHLLVATEMKGPNRELRLRASDGSALWALKTIDSAGNSYSVPYSRYLVLSHLHGMKVDCRGNECGKVKDIILDRNSGEIAFLSIDPNQKFLGVGDTNRLIPWSVATVALDGTMHIDASKEMVLASPETPNDLTVLKSGMIGERVYKAFNVSAPRFEAPKPVSATTPDAANAWSARGTILKEIEYGSTKPLVGEVIDISEIKFEKGVPPARAVKMKLAGDGAGEALVLLGPDWYLENQKPICKVGDSIKVEACRTMIEGHKYWLARSVECKDARMVLLDKNDGPAWAQP